MRISRFTIELTVTTLTFLAGMAIIADSMHLGVAWSNDSPESGYFPLRIGAILAIASIAIAAQSMLDTSAAAREPFVSWARFKLVLAVLIPTAFYVVGIATIGIYVSSALFMAVFMRVAGRFGWLTTAAVSLSTAIMLFWLFELQFLVPLPKGPLEALLGY